MDNPTTGSAGMVSIPVDDVLYSMNGDTWTGTNITSSMYFTIEPAGSGSGQNAPQQATFELIREYSDHLRGFSDIFSNRHYVFHRDRVSHALFGATMVLKNSTGPCPLLQQALPQSRRRPLCQRQLHRPGPHRAQVT